MSDLEFVVKYAYYGNSAETTPTDVADEIKKMLKKATKGQEGIVTVSDLPDPAPGKDKAFGACIEIHGTTTHQQLFAAIVPATVQNAVKIDFEHHKEPAARPTPVVQSAFCGATVNQKSISTDVKAALQELINDNNGVVTINSENLRLNSTVAANAWFLSANVNVNGINNVPFIAAAGDKVNFQAFSSVPTTGKKSVTVNHAIWGVLDTDENQSVAVDVTNNLQIAINRSEKGIVRLNPAALGTDPVPGVRKGFVASVNRGGEDRLYALFDDWSIDFV